MPLYIDPEWEYQVSDPEIEEIFNQHKVEDWYFDVRVYNKTKNIGFIYGKGDPNNTRTFLGRAKKGIKSKEIVLQVCPTCGTCFNPYKTGQIYCDTRCYIRLGRRRTLPALCQCEVCQKEFRPNYSGNVICSRKCASAKRRPKERYMEYEEEFKTMYLSGCLMKEIQDRFGISLPTAKRWKKLLDLPARLSGNHSNSQKN